MVNATGIRASQALKWGLLGAGIAAVALPALGATAIVGTLGTFGTALAGIATLFGIQTAAGAAVVSTVASTALMIYGAMVAAAGVLTAFAGAVFADGKINREENREKMEHLRRVSDARRENQERLLAFREAELQQRYNMGLVPNAPYSPGPGVSPGGPGVGNVG